MPIRWPLHKQRILPRRRPSTRWREFSLAHRHVVPMESIRPNLRGEIMRLLPLTLCLMGASACSHPHLVGRGSEVVLLQPSATPNCERLGSMVGKSWGSVFFGDSLLASAENSLRNHAGDAGATHVVETRRDPSAHAYFVEGDAYRCPPVTAPTPTDANSALAPPPAADPVPGDATPLPPAAPTP